MTDLGATIAGIGGVISVFAALGWMLAILGPRREPSWNKQMAANARAKSPGFAAFGALLVLLGLILMFLDSAR